MRHAAFILIFILGAGARPAFGQCYAPVATTQAGPPPAVPCPTPIIHLKQLDSLLGAPTAGKVRVINFWATWCKPCVGELPGFDSAAARLGGSMELHLLSLDNKKDALKKLPGFLKRKGIKAPVALLDEPDYNSWIDHVSPDWAGAIPATIVIGPKGKAFFEGEMTAPQLLALMNRVQ